MQDREFEKDVRQKMQELRFAPNAGVWARVQADIQKKKRRRPLIIFLLLAGLLAGSALLYVGMKDQSTGHPKAQLQPQQTIHNKKQEPVQIQEENNNTRQVQPERITPVKKAGTEQTGTQTIKPANNKEEKATKEKSLAELLQKNTSYLHVRRQPIIKANPGTRVTAGNKQQQSNTSDVFPSINQQVQQQVITSSGKDEQEEQIDAVTGNDKRDSASITNTDTTSIKKSITVPKSAGIDKTTDSAAKKPFGAKAGKKKKDWEWGASAGIGYANVKGTASPGKSFERLYANTPTRDSLVAPAAPRGSLAYNAGVYLSKGVSKRLRVKAGLNYEYFSTSTPVGAFVDSLRVVNLSAGNVGMVNAFYRSGVQNKYKTNYHFISLPLSVQWQINRNAKRSIVWENGISLMQLLSTNALQYDPLTRSYFKDNDELHKTQWMASSSLMFRFETKGKRHMYVGPQLQYALGNLVKDADNKHLRYAGIKLMTGLNKK